MSDIGSVESLSDAMRKQERERPRLRYNDNFLCLVHWWINRIHYHQYQMRKQYGGIKLKMVYTALPSNGYAFVIVNQGAGHRLALAMGADVLTSGD